MIPYINPSNSAMLAVLIVVAARLSLLISAQRNVVIMPTGGNKKAPQSQNVITFNKPKHSGTISDGKSRPIEAPQQNFQWQYPTVWKTAKYEYGRAKQNAQQPGAVIGQIQNPNPWYRTPGVSNVGSLPTSNQYAAPANAPAANRNIPQGGFDPNYGYAGYGGGAGGFNAYGGGQGGYGNSGGGANWGNTGAQSNAWKKDPVTQAPKKIPVTPSKKKAPVTQAPKKAAAVPLSLPSKKGEAVTGRPRLYPARRGSLYNIPGRNTPLFDADAGHLCNRGQPLARTLCGPGEGTCPPGFVCDIRRGFDDFGRCCMRENLCPDFTLALTMGSCRLNTTFNDCPLNFYCVTIALNSGNVNMCCNSRRNGVCPSVRIQDQFTSTINYTIPLQGLATTAPIRQAFALAIPIPSCPGTCIHDYSCMAPMKCCQGSNGCPMCTNPNSAQKSLNPTAHISPLELEALVEEGPTRSRFRGAPLLEGLSPGILEGPTETFKDKKGPRLIVDEGEEENVEIAALSASNPTLTQGGSNAGGLFSGLISQFASNKGNAGKNYGSVNMWKSGYSAPASTYLGMSGSSNFGDGKDQTAFILASDMASKVKAYNDALKKSGNVEKDGTIFLSGREASVMNGKSMYDRQQESVSAAPNWLSSLVQSSNTNTKPIYLPAVGGSSQKSQPVSSPQINANRAAGGLDPYLVSNGMAAQAYNQPAAPPMQEGLSPYFNPYYDPYAPSSIGGGVNPALQVDPYLPGGGLRLYEKRTPTSMRELIEMYKGKPLPIELQLKVAEFKAREEEKNAAQAKASSALEFNLNNDHSQEKLAAVPYKGVTSDPLQFLLPFIYHLRQKDPENSQGDTPVFMSGKKK